MRWVKLLVAVSLVLGPVVVTAGSAKAQVFLNLYAGAAFPQLEDTEAKAATGRAENSVGFKDSFVLGGRVGAWGTDVGLGWFGMAIDVSYWQSEAEDSILGAKPEIKVLPVTVLLMFRYPGEKVQPYAGVGGGLFLSQLENDADFSQIGISSTGNFKDTQADLGFDARAGLAVRVSKKISIFAEGRYAYTSPEYEDKIDGEKVTLSTDVESIQALAGISFHF